MGGVGFQSRHKYTAGNFHGFRVGRAFTDWRGDWEKNDHSADRYDFFQTPKTTPLNQQTKKATHWLSVVTVSVWDNENILGIINGDGCTILSM